MADERRQRRRFLTARWRYLAMLNFAVEPAILRPWVPRGTELDLWRGTALATVVGFRFLDTRVRGFPIPLHRNFDEVNLRFYVRREAKEETRRGVVFVKEVVPRRAIAWLARRLYGENYVALPMRHELAIPAAGEAACGRVRYEWRLDGRWNRLEAELAGAPELPAADSEETFVTEHYWGYAAQPDGGTIEYRVEHPRWRVWRAPAAELDCAAAELYGEAFREPLASPPVSAFVAEGSAVTVRQGRRLERGRRGRSSAATW